MADIDDAISSLAAGVASFLAPYQPNLPGYPNPSPFAGQIVPTLVGPGEAIQVKVLVRLENHMAHVDVYEGHITASRPFERQGYIPSMADATPSPVPLNPGQISYNKETSREVKEVIVRVWAETHAAREAIAGLIRSNLGDYYRQSENDGTVTLIRYMNQSAHNEEQKDSIYVKQLHYMVDLTGVVATVFTPVVETITTVTQETINGVVTATKVQMVP